MASPIKGRSKTAGPARWNNPPTRTDAAPTVLRVFIIIDIFFISLIFVVGVYSYS